MQRGKKTPKFHGSAQNSVGRGKLVSVYYTINWLTERSLSVIN